MSASTLPRSSSPSSASTRTASLCSTARPRAAPPLTRTRAPSSPQRISCRTSIDFDRFHLGSCFCYCNEISDCQVKHFSFDYALMDLAFNLIFDLRHEWICAVFDMIYNILEFLVIFFHYNFVVHCIINYYCRKI